MISIIICTHNRSELLGHCLESFMAQTVGHEVFELVVVDNNSTDGTKSVVNSMQLKLPKLRYVKEERIGLSHARNKGYHEAVHEWVGYVDDDAKAYPNLVERALYIIDNFKFDCFGGRFFPWYLTPKPKWLSEDFGLFPLLRQDVGPLPANKDVAGGVIFFRKEALEAVGGFPINLGMSGNKIGYGEENWVQNEMRKKSFVIGFDPELKIDHLVADYKYTLRWHLKRVYAKGQTERITLREKSNKKLFLMLMNACASAMYRLTINLPSVLGKRDYYWENYILDSVGYLVKVAGYLSSPRRVIRPDQ
jgi:glucosyl-dolichyl phosphate glucuronosyltransferase